MNSNDIITAQPLIQHLIELRRRLMWSVIAFIVTSAAAYMFAEDIYGFLTSPLAEQMAKNVKADRRLIYTGLTEAFTTYLKVALFTGGFITVPFIMVQIWLFLAPGLFHEERKAILPYFIAAPFLFMVGAVFCFYGVMPVAWDFFLNFEVQQPKGGLPVILEARVAEYLSLFMTLIFAFGLAFQLPVILGLLTQLNIIRLEHLIKFRKWALLAIVIVAGILTPPDVLSQSALAIPLYCLYEISILLVRYKQRKKSGETDARS